MEFVATTRFRDFYRPLWNDLGDETRDIVLRMRPRGQAVPQTRLSVHCLRSLNDTKVGLRWTILPIDSAAA